MSARLPLQVLVVDDDDVDRERVRRLLDRSSLDCDVYEVCTGAEALDRVQAQAFDCVMLDHHLGDSDGTDLLQQLHQRARRDCPIIMITGAGSEALAARAMREGAADYLLKTQLSVETLAGALSRCLEHHRVRAELAALYQQLEQRVQQQAAVLQQRERDLQALIDNAPNVMGYWDRDLRCRFGNHTHEPWFGVAASALPGQPLQAVLGPSLAQALGPEVDAALGGHTRVTDGWLPPAGGRPERHLQVQLSPDRDDAGAVVGFYLTMTDVSAIRRARDAAESATRAKSAFLANMSHEIRTPMNAIVGLTRLALLDELPPATREHLHNVHTSALALMGILDDVLDYSKIEAGQLALERVEFDLEDSLQRLADLFQVRIEHKGLSSSIGVDPGLPRRFHGDPLRLSQVLTNLVGNAVKFTERGHIHLQVSGTQAPDRLRFSVADTGIGIPAAQRARLFEAFVQGDDSITRRFGGTGLGLAICRQLVQMMDGEIGVDSQPGQGSEFWFTARLPAASDVPQRPWLRQRRALVVGANLRTRQLLAQQLQTWGLAVEAAADVGTARLRMKTAQPGPDLVLVDVGDEQDLLDLASLRPRVDAAGGVTLVLLLESGTQTALERSQAQHAADIVLRKPVLPSRLLAALQQPPGTAAGADGALAQAQDETRRLHRQAAPLRGARVLLAEDNRLNQIVATELLWHLGFEVTVVADGAAAVAAVAAAADEPFDAVLMDVHMPEVDGLEATRRIRALPIAAALPVIGMTAAVMSEDRARCLDAGMVDHVAKPIMPERLLQVLLQWVLPRQSSPSGTAAAASGPALDTTVSEDVHESPVAGLDLAGLRRRLGGREALVWSLLAAYLQTEGQAADQVEQLLQQGDIGAARARLHDLKGSAGNLGLTAIAAAVLRFEQALAQSAAVAAERARFRQSYARAIGELRRLLAARGSVPLPPASGH